MQGFPHRRAGICDSVVLNGHRHTSVEAASERIAVWLRPGVGVIGQVTGVFCLTWEMRDGAFTLRGSDVEVASAEGIDAKSSCASA